MKIIINADDLGRNDETNRAIVYLLEKGMIDRTSLMINMPGIEELVKTVYEKNLSEKVILHFNITEGHPLSREIKSTVFCANGGHFSNPIPAKCRIFLTKKEKKSVNDELNAQIDRFSESKFKLYAIDSHNYTSADWSILNIFLKNEILRNCSIRYAKNIKFGHNKGLKYIYRKIANYSIKKHNSKVCQAITLPDKSYSPIYPINSNVHYFGSHIEFFELMKKTNTSLADAVCEIMVHPIFDNNGIIIDNSTKEELIPIIEKIRGIATGDL